MNSQMHLKTITPEDLFQFKFLQDVKLSPDGKMIVYVVIRTEKIGPGEEDQSDIWLLSLETGESRKLSGDNSHDGNPSWSPDGKRIAHLSQVDGTNQIVISDVAGLEKKAVTQLSQGVKCGPVWSPNGEYLAFTAGFSQPAFDPTKPYRLTRTLYRFDSIGYLDNNIDDLYVVQAEGGEPRRLVHNDCLNSNPSWSSDSREILFLSSLHPDSKIFYPQVSITDLEGNWQTLTDKKFMVSAATWLPGGDKIAFLALNMDLPIGSKQDLWVIGRDGLHCECRTEGLIYPAGGLVQVDMPLPMDMSTDRLILKDHDAYLSVQDGGEVPLYRVALAGPLSWEPVVTGKRMCVAVGCTSDRIAFIATDLNHPPDLYCSRLDGSDERRLTHLNDDLLSCFRLPSVEHLNFTAVDHVPLEGWFLKPPVGEPPYPTILYIHGGPHYGFGHAFSFDFQMLAGAGYGVLFANQRGSTGYGDEFSTRIIGDWGNLDYQDLMSAVDYAVEQELADPNRLGVCGISGGGNLSCWIVGHTDRFKAAVPENPVTDWNSMYGASDISLLFAPLEMGGLPCEIPEVYARCSPITYAHRCKTPTLLVQGEKDYRCPAIQSEEFYAVLKAHGCVVEMLRLPDSSHDGSIKGPPVIRRAQNEALIDWMNRYVMGKPA